MDCGDYPTLVENQKYEQITLHPITKYLSILSVICLEGFIWNDDMKTQFISCTYKGSWSQITAECNRI